MRPVVPPYKNTRVGKPQKVNLKERIIKIASGKRHCLAVTEYGRLLGWGYNHQQQLSHGQDMVNETTQRLVIYEPISITNSIEGKRVVLMDAGEDFSIIVTEDSRGIQESWGTGKFYYFR